MTILLRALRSDQINILIFFFFLLAGQDVYNMYVDWYAVSEGLEVLRFNAQI